MPNIIRHFASNANIRGDFSSTYTKPPFRALHPPRHHQTPAMRASFPIIPRPHCGRCFPSRNMSHLPAADVNSPSPNIPHLPAADVYSPSPFMEMGVADRPGVRSTHAIIPRPHCGRPSFPLSKYTTFASGRCLLPISKYTTSASGRCLLPISIYGDGGGRQAGGEVHPRHHPLRYPCFGKHR